MSRHLLLMRASFLAVALATAACGRTPEEVHLEKVRALCEDLAARHAGASEAERLLGPPTWTGCTTDLPPAPGEDRCPGDGTEICLRVWAYRAQQQALCGGFACSYGCELRAPAGDAEATCATRFFGDAGAAPAPLP